MSLILDALNRAEQERNEKNHIPTLQSVHRSGDQTPRSLLQRLHPERWLIALVIGYLAFDFFRDRVPQADAPGSAAAGSAEVASAPPPQTRGEATRTGVVVTAAPPEHKAAVPEPNPVSSKPVMRPTPVETTPGPVAAAPPDAIGNASRPVVATGEPLPAITVASDGTPVAAETVPSEAGDTTTSQAQMPGRTPNPKVESLYRTPPQTSPRAADRGAPTTSGGGTGQGAERAFMRTQQITDLSLDLRHRIPSLKYNEHDAGGRSSDRHVVLNGNLYRQGDTVADGLRLVEISESGIVLEFEGERFRLGAYNSWINFQ
jgi:general secretion pathway protein B